MAKKKGLDLNDLQGEVMDITARAQALVADLACAESCETKADFTDNIAEAVQAASDVVSLLKELKERMT